MLFLDGGPDAIHLRAEPGVPGGVSPDPKKIGNAKLEADAIASAALPLDEPDKCEEDALNQILWRAMKGTEVPFPDWAVAKVEDDDD